ncbi:hypothetical protein [Mycobacterium servetii]|uniref:Uncharacterized protein n=1 Tax=Mycobacterium servetii TaxID=3237418 RepID=A0ABV4C9E2_9MYCO
MDDLLLDPADELPDHNPAPSRLVIAPDIRAPLEHPYSGADVILALPRSDAIDPTAVPADLAAKAAAYGDDLHCVSESSERRRPQKGLRGIVTRLAVPVRDRFIVGATAATGAVGAPIAATYTSSPLYALGAAIVVAGFLLTWQSVSRDISRLWGRPRPLYSDTEVEALQNASTEWPVIPDDLDRYPNHTVLRQEWNSHWPWNSYPPLHLRGAAIVWREPHLVAIANLIGRDIAASAAWRSELFDLHRVRIDLDQTLTDINLRAHRIWRARANLVPPPSDSPEDPVARRNNEILDAAEKAWDALVELVRQLIEYQKQLAPINAMVAEIAALELSATKVTDDAVRQLAIDAASTAYKTDTITAATAELTELKANLTARLEFLRQALTEPDNILPITARGPHPAAGR